MGTEGESESKDLDLGHLQPRHSSFLASLCVTDTSIAELPSLYPDDAYSTRTTEVVCLLHLPPITYAKMMCALRGNARMLLLIYVWSAAQEGQALLAYPGTAYTAHS